MENNKVCSHCQKGGHRTGRRFQKNDHHYLDEVSEYSFFTKWGNLSGPSPFFFHFSLSVLYSELLSDQVRGDSFQVLHPFAYGPGRLWTIVCPRTILFAPPCRPHEARDGAWSTRLCHREILRQTGDTLGQVGRCRCDIGPLG